MNTVGRTAAIGILSILLAACGSARDANKSNFSKAIQAYLDTQKGLCASVPGEKLPFSLANQGMFGNSKKMADALADAGLLSRQDTQVKAMFGNRMEAGTEYQITDMGKQYLVPGGANTVGGHDAFCSGKYEVAEVENFTEPSEMMGATISRVNFRYRVAGGAGWTRSEGLAANYRSFKEQADGEIKGNAVLVLTNEGWLHERLFRR